MLKPFSKNEKKIVRWIFGIVIAISLLNFKGALRKARDYQRKYDVNRIVDALEVYREEFGFYPPSSGDGKIIGCRKEGTNSDDLLDTRTGETYEQKLRSVFKECEWGKDPLQDITDLNYPPYLSVLPQDPDTDKGVSYFYTSNISYFQILGALEGKSEPEYRESVEARGIYCGKITCNFGKSLNNVPLDIPVEEFVEMETE